MTFEFTVNLIGANCTNVVYLTLSFMPSTKCILELDLFIRKIIIMKLVTLV